MQHLFNDAIYNIIFFNTTFHISIAIAIVILIGN